MSASFCGVEQLAAQTLKSASQSQDNCEDNSVPAAEVIEELRKRFNPANARNLSATYLITVRGQGGGSWLTKISDGTLEMTQQPPDSPAQADCLISVEAEDLEEIIAGRLSAMTAALSGVLSIEGELGLAMQLVPVFFEGQAPFI